MKKDPKKVFAEYLRKHHKGESNAVHAIELRHLGSKRMLRKYASDLRANGIPICSNDNGYFYAKDMQEIRDMRRRIKLVMDELMKGYCGLVLSDMREMGCAE